MLSFPPHWSHYQQSLDIAVYGSFKKYFKRACDNCMTNYKNVITIYDIPEILNTIVDSAF